MRGGASVVAQAPSAKRALERFVHVMHSLFLRAGEPPEAIAVGFLKHRDIDGNAMPSQVRHTCASGSLRVFLAWHIGQMYRALTCLASSGRHIQ